MSERTRTPPRIEHWLWAAVVLAVGLGGGLAGRRGLEGDAPADGRSAGPRVAPKSDRVVRATPARSTLRSGESVESLLAEAGPDRYGRTALWLLDAGPGEIARLWNGLIEDVAGAGPMLELVLRRWAQVDAAAALAATKGTRWELTAWAAWGRADPERAIETALREHSDRASIVLEGIGTTDPEHALFLLERYPHLASGFSIGGIAEGLFEIDPQRAVEFARSFGHGNDELHERWAEREPEDFLAWCAQNELGGALSSRTREALGAIARAHPERLEELAGALRPGGLRSELLRAAVAELAWQDADAALAIADRQTDAHLRLILRNKIGEALAHADPPRAFELLRRVADDLPDVGSRAISPAGPLWPQQASGYLNGWVHNLMNVDPLETVALVRELLPGIEDYAVRSWMHRDPRAFGEWLREEPPGEQQQRHIANFVQTLITLEESHYPQAIEWATRIDNPDRRPGAMRSVVMQWSLSEGREAVERYLATPEAVPGAREAYQAYLEEQAEK